MKLKLVLIIRYTRAAYQFEHRLLCVERSNWIELNRTESNRIEREWKRDQKSKFGVRSRSIVVCLQLTPFDKWCSLNACVLSRSKWRTRLTSDHQLTIDGVRVKRLISELPPGTVKIRTRSVRMCLRVSWELCSRQNVTPRFWATLEPLTVRSVHVLFKHTH